MTADISRKFSDREKHFAALQRQQGRIPTDAEENAADDLLRFAQETAFLEAICPLGSPDDGFKVALRPGDDAAFDIMAGSFYLGGTRIENGALLDFADQAGEGWLTMAAGDLPAAGSRVLVWLEAEEHTVTAFEDAELFEPALRGADGAARKRMAWRVRQGATDEDTCADALADVIDPAVLDARNPLTGAIEPTGTLTVGFDGTAPDLDLCKPATEPGYLGNRNNCYRVKVTPGNRFVWGDDNGSQLYRVTIAGDRKSLTFVNQPRDEYLRPRAGQTIELLRPDVLLPNLEKAAEADGYLLKASANFDGESVALATDAGIESDLGDLDTWLSGLDAGLFDGPERHFYARIWTGGGEGSAVDHGFSAGTPVELAGTGLTVTFDGAVLAGTSWTLAARPDAPERVLPWGLHGGMEAHAPRRYLVPLAIVDLAAAEIHHCRPHFRPLWRIQSCCTVTVGDGETSHGDVPTIEQALGRLPPAGGTVCLLPGTHRANITLEGLDNIRFSGCKGLSRWIAEDPAEPLATLVDCTRIGFSDIEMEAVESCCILASKSEPLADDIANGGLSISGCTLLARAGWAVAGRHLDGATVENCEIVAGPLQSRDAADATQSLAALFLAGHRLRVEKCRITAPLAEGQAESLRAMGGIHIGGGSSEIDIRDNLVEGGAGMGVMLGSIHVETEVIEGPRDYLEEATQGHLEYTITAAGCIVIEWFPPPGGDGEEEIVERIRSDGEVSQVRIDDNEILSMGSAGIGSFPLLLIAEDGTPADDAILVSFLLVSGNRIRECSLYEPGELGPVGRLFTGRGGIALSLVADSLFRDNRIEENGGLAGYESCGISIIYGEDTRIYDNIVERNDVFAEGRRPLGPNSGIDIKLAIGGLASASEGADPGAVDSLAYEAPAATSAGLAGAAMRIRQIDRAALAIHGNQVHQPAGRAIRVLAIGPVLVQDNFLTGAQPSRLFTDLSGAVAMVREAVQSMSDNVRELLLVILDTILDLAGGDAVQIVNLGLAQDLITLFVGRSMRFANETNDSTDSGEEFDEAGGQATQKQSLGGFLAQVVNGQFFARLPATFQRGGETALSDNQISIKRPFPNGPQGSLSSILVATLDDCQFSDNQFEADIDRAFVLFDAVLLAVTLRAIGNRGQEGALCWRSIAAYALGAANVSHNQTTVPLDVGGTAALELHNQSAL